MIFKFIQNNYNKKYLEFISELYYPSGDSWSLKNSLLEACKNTKILAKGDIFWPLRDFARDVNFVEEESGFYGEIYPHVEPDKIKLPFIIMLFFVNFEREECQLQVKGTTAGVYSGLLISENLYEDDGPTIMITSNNSKTDHLQLLKTSLVNSGNFNFYSQ